MTDFILPISSFRYTSQGPDYHRANHASFDGHTAQRLPDEYALSPASGPVDLAFNPWLVGASPTSSPMSRGSSPSGSDYPTTPPQLNSAPSYSDHPAVYHQMNQPRQEYMVRDPNCISNSENTWNRQYNNSYVQPPAHFWNGGAYGGSLLASTNYYVPPYIDLATPSSPQLVASNRAARNSSDLAKRKSPKDDSGSSSSSSSGSDSDDADYEDEDPDYIKARSNAGSKSKDAASASMFKLGKWSMGIDPLTHALDERRYHCSFVSEDGVPCDSRFQRPEHLRRHSRTVHGTLQEYVCKVPGCHRPFSRGDNLREHYWTHLERGGRAGKNSKWSFPELKAILGKGERRLAKKLKQKLMKQQKRGLIKSKL
ncbi:hypothetical protein EK21DRAFT_115995 [Setomelanomma holmii]|uniref:C2H2-type domain-containing protein n=1 Tax=Setomelanomma holmii TaxID=210430 RepID=A0A9P4LGZ3_9PLEO|nr:hypothetical protein EK21DRAFT_115995 [Setomelanomma holmii]